MDLEDPQGGGKPLTQSVKLIFSIHVRNGATEKRILLQALRCKPMHISLLTILVGPSLCNTQ